MSGHGVPLGCTFPLCLGYALGAAKGFVDDGLQLLQRFRYAEPNDWSEPLPVVAAATHPPEEPSTRQGVRPPWCEAGRWRNGW